MLSFVVTTWETVKSRTNPTTSPTHKKKHHLQHRQKLIIHIPHSLQSLN
jgi:hypothetical protein